MQTALDAPDSPGALRLPAAAVQSIYERYSRIWMLLLLGVSDMLCLSVSVALAIAIRTAFDEASISLPLYLRVLPLLLLFLVSYAWNGLYPGVGMNPVEELHRISTSTSAVFLLVTAASFWVRAGASYSRLVIAISWLLALALVPSGRWIVRRLAIRAGLWGEPVAVIGYGPRKPEDRALFFKEIAPGSASGAGHRWRQPA